MLILGSEAEWLAFVDNLDEWIHPPSRLLVNIMPKALP
jgi:hypothetical protein